MNSNNNSQPSQNPDQHHFEIIKDSKALTCDHIQEFKQLCQVDLRMASIALNRLFIKFYDWNLNPVIKVSFIHFLRSNKEQQRFILNYKIH